MELIYSLYLITAIIYLSLCAYCSKTGKDRGLKQSGMFWLALFGTPVIAYLHMIVVFMKKTTAQENIEKGI